MDDMSHINHSEGHGGGGKGVCDWQTVNHEIQFSVRLRGMQSSRGIGVNPPALLDKDTHTHIMCKHVHTHTDTHKDIQCSTRRERHEMIKTNTHAKRETYTQTLTRSLS